MTTSSSSIGSGLWLKVRKTLGYHARRMHRRGRDLVWQARRPYADRPIFVIGCSRAGTTLVYKTLSVSPEAGSLNRETHDYWQSLHPIESRNWSSHVLTSAEAGPDDRAQVSRYFYRHTGQRRFVDKNNQNGLCVDYLHAVFPDAVFVYVKRSPGDNISSLMQGWRRPEEFATWSGDLPARVNIDNGEFTRWCFFLPEGWRDYLCASLEQVCAFQYTSMNEAILEAKRAIPPGQWYEIRYEDIVRDPVAAFRSIYAHCSLAFTSGVEQHCGNVLNTPYNAFSSIEVDKWRQSPDRTRIEAVMPLVVDTARRMGYEATAVER